MFSYPHINIDVSTYNNHCLKIAILYFTYFDFVVETFVSTYVHMQYAFIKEVEKSLKSKVLARIWFIGLKFKL